LPSGTNNVRARYRSGTGLAGNVPAGLLEIPLRPHPLVDKVRQPINATGGGDMESRDALKRNAPASVLTLERAVSAVDYAYLATAHAAVWAAQAFSSPTVRQRRRIEVVVVPAGGIALDARLQGALEAFLKTHSQPGVDVLVREFDRVWLHLDITLRIVSSEYDPQAVKAQAIAQLKEAFALERRAIGAPLYLSDVFAVVETLAGVRNSSCRLLSERAGETITAADQQITANQREVIFLDLNARPGALRIQLEEFEL
jgi:predicted phage baseplate assembly protein